MGRYAIFVIVFGSWFAPLTCTHSFGSTGASVCMYADTHFPRFRFRLLRLLMGFSFLLLFLLPWLLFVLALRLPCWAGVIRCVR